jgi:KaiC/GvpD/RAD55 family RecA-like ATPase
VLPDRRNLVREARQRLGVVPITDAPLPDVSGEQFTRARTEIFTPPAVVVEFPYASLHREVDRLTSGQLVFVMANTGQGKTTFLLDVQDRWAEAGVKIDYLGTEQEPFELITKWACLRVDVHPGVAISKSWDAHPQGAEWQERVRQEIHRIEQLYGEQVKFSPDKFITLAKIEQAAKRAHERGGHVLFVDHIDRVDIGPKAEVGDLTQLVRRLKELGRDYKLLMVVASQMNREARKMDRLGAYRAPQLHQMQGSAAKEHEADVALGLWRPLRQQLPGETAKEFAATMAAAKAGHIQVSDVTERNTMAVVLLKHRIFGERDGNRCKLHVRHGRLSDIPERDRHSTTYDGVRRV